MLETLANTDIQYDASAHTDARTETAVVPVSKLPHRHELFVQALVSNGGNLREAYESVYPKSGSRLASWNNACRLRARPEVRERLNELTRLAAARVVIDRAALIQDLYDIATADPGEVSRIVVSPCPACWSEDRIAVALDAAAAPGGLLADFDEPRPDCEHCKGYGLERVVNMPTDALSGPARRLYAGARQRADGSVEPLMHDQLAARKMLHDLLGMTVHRSVNTNVNVTVDPTKPNPWDGSALTPEQVLERVRRARAPLTIEHQP